MIVTAQLLIATAFANVPTYDVTITAAAGAREVTGSHLTVRADRPAKITQTDANGTLEVELTARPDGDHIFVAADITHVDDHGRRRHVGRPQIMALANEPAAIEAGEQNPRTGRDEVRYAMRVLAKTKN